MKTELRCMKCASHGFFIVKVEILEAHYTGDTGGDPTVLYEYECTDCGETKKLEWEEVED